jgi:hypothetical protein
MEMADAGARQAPASHLLATFKSRVPPQEAAFALALAASQSALLLVIVKPCPLQEFWPLQLLCADLHEDMPLQEFAPSHFTLPSSAAAAVKEAVENRIAAAAAKAMLPVFRVFMNPSPFMKLKIRSLDRPPE